MKWPLLHMFVIFPKALYYLTQKTCHQLLCRLRSIAAHRDHYCPASVCVCVQCVCLVRYVTPFLIVTLVNTIAALNRCIISLSNLQDMLTVMRGCTLLILRASEVKGPIGHTGHLWIIKLVNTIET